jgi:uncharacterized protein (TIGR02147 family)
MNIEEVKSFHGISDYLKAILVYRCKSNSQYSLRSFAKSLEISNSALSAMLNGKRAISLKMIDRFSEKLGLTPEDTSYFKEQSIKEKNGKITEQELAEINYKELTHDVYKVMSDWYYMAILQLTHLKDFEPSVSFITRTFGLEKNIAEEAVERLQRLGLLKIYKNTWEDTTNRNLTNEVTQTQTTSAAMLYQKQLREKAMDAIFQTAPKFRDHSSMVMAIKKDDIPQAKEKIKRFRRSLSKYLERHKKGDEIYQLTVSLFPLSNIEE